MNSDIDNEVKSKLSVTSEYIDESFEWFIAFEDLKAFYFPMKHHFLFTSQFQLLMVLMERTVENIVGKRDSDGN